MRTAEPQEKNIRAAGINTNYDKKLKYDIDKIKPGRVFTITEAVKATPTSIYQPNTTVKAGKALQTTEIMVTSVEDRREYLYIGIRPTGRDAGRFGFGAMRIYKAGPRDYGVVVLEARYNYRSENHEDAGRTVDREHSARRKITTEAR